MFLWQKLFFFLLILGFVGCFSEKKVDCSSLISSEIWKSDIIQTDLMGDVEMEFQFEENGTYKLSVAFTDENGVTATDETIGQYFVDESCNIEIKQDGGPVGPPFLCAGQFPL